VKLASGELCTWIFNSKCMSLEDNGDFFHVVLNGEFLEFYQSSESFLRGRKFRPIICRSASSQVGRLWYRMG
jgi:hypothetical protein